MPVSNLAVCFGPTLLRPEEETVASIMDLKFYNVVVEILIENYEKIFKSVPDPPQPEHNNQSPPPPSQTINIESLPHVIQSNGISNHSSPGRYSSPPVTHVSIFTSKSNSRDRI